MATKHPKLKFAYLEPSCPFKILNATSRRQTFDLITFEHDYNIHDFDCAPKWALLEAKMCYLAHVI